MCIVKPVYKHRRSGEKHGIIGLITFQKIDSESHCKHTRSCNRQTARSINWSMVRLVLWYAVPRCHVTFHDIVCVIAMRHFVTEFVPVCDSVQLYRVTPHYRLCSIVMWHFVTVCWALSCDTSWQSAQYCRMTLHNIVYHIIMWHFVTKCVTPSAYWAVTYGLFFCHCLELCHGATVFINYWIQCSVDLLTYYQSFVCVVCQYQCVWAQLTCW